MMGELYTIGHSNHPAKRFLEFLSRHEIGIVGDVRSHPYSRYNPQYRREEIKEALRENNIAYVFLGRELGARSNDPACYVNGKVQFDRLAVTDLFQQGLFRLRESMKLCRVCLMCAEKDPLTCHRTILICRHLRNYNLEIRHILEDGSLENNSDSEVRLLRMLKMPLEDLFRETKDSIEEAYDVQGQRIAYSRQ